MKQGSTLFLKVVILLIGIAALSIMIWFPQTEGRAANLDLVNIYKDSFILYIYISSIPFFIGLYQTFKLLRNIEQNKAFSQISVKTLQNIKACALLLIVEVIAAIVYIRFASGGDDPAGAIAVGICVMFGFIVIATGAATIEKLFQNALDLKSENDLTV